jgi:hypothetical protein
MASVPLGALALVFRLCEQQPPRIDWHVLTTHFDRLGEELIDAGALVETSPTETIIMPVDIDDELITFEWEADRQAFVGFHPNVVDADPRARKRYRLDFDWLLRAIASAAGMSSGQRAACLVHDLLWDLGDARLRERRRPILFACRLGSTDALDRVEGVLTARAGRADGVLLTTSTNQSGGAAAWTASDPPHSRLPRSGRAAFRARPGRDRRRATRGGAHRAGCGGDGRGRRLDSHS